MRSDRSGPLVVLHVMRTYGAHGGERQLAQYLAAEPAGEVREHFAFLYRDDDCAALFGRQGARVTLHRLLPFAIAPRQRPWAEVAIVLPLLPLLQLRLFALFRRLRPHICVVHGVQAALVVWPLGMLWRRRVGFLYLHRTTKAIGRHPALRWLYAPYRLVGGVSRAVTRSLAAVANRSRLVALENGVDTSALEHALATGREVAPRSGEVLIAVGRLMPDKRQDLLIAALARLSPERPDLVLWIVGDGPERKDLEAEAARLGLADRVVFWGYRSDVPRLLAAATLFVNASSWEGMSNAVLEGMALGLASVVVDAPGVSECHVPGETGIVVPSDAGALAEAVAALLDDPDRRGRLGKAARARVHAHYSIEANRRRFLDVYRRLAEEA